MDKITWFSFLFCVTNRCNRGCRHCLGEYSDDGCLELAPQDIDQLKPVFDELAAFQTWKSIVITGGEPLLNKRLPAIYERCLALDPDGISIITTGFLPGSEEQPVGEWLLNLSDPRFRLLTSFNLYAPELVDRFQYFFKRWWHSPIDNLEVLIAYDQENFQETFDRLNLVTDEALPEVKCKVLGQYPGDPLSGKFELSDGRGRVKKSSVYFRPSDSRGGARFLSGLSRNYPACPVTGGSKGMVSEKLQRLNLKIGPDGLFYPDQCPFDGQTALGKLGEVALRELVKRKGWCHQLFDDDAAISAEDRAMLSQDPCSVCRKIISEKTPPWRR